jgi:tetratricopeptide (TPR) repeat protein
MLAFFVLHACERAVVVIPEPPLLGVEEEVVQEIRTRARAVAANPRDGRLWGRYGVALDAHGLEIEAEEAYRRAMDLDPDQIRWPYYLGALIEVRFPEQAVQFYERAVANDPAYAPAQIRLAQRLEQLGRDDEAERHYQRARELEPKNPFALLGLGSIALRRGDVETAVRHLELAYELDSTLHATVAALAQACHRAGRLDEARERAAQARSLPRITYQPDELRAEIKEAAVDRRSYVRRAVTYRDVGQFERALREARAGRARAPDDVQAQLLVADIEYRMGDYVAAEASARAALRLAPARCDIRELLALVLYERGGFDEAVELATGVLDEEESPNMHMLLGRVAGRRGRNDEAIRQLEMAVAQRSDETEWQLMLARLLAAAGRIEEAGKHLLLVVEKRPEQADAWNELGYVHLDGGETRLALDAFERALHLGAGPESLPGMVQASLELRGVEGTAAQLTSLAQGQGDLAFAARLQLAVLLAAQRQFGAARQHLAALLAERPQWSEAWLQLGLLELADRQPAAAARALERAARAAGEDPAASARAEQLLAQLERVKASC